MGVRFRHAAACIAGATPSAGGSEGCYGQACGPEGSKSVANQRRRGGPVRADVPAREGVGATCGRGRGTRRPAPSSRVKAWHEVHDRLLPQGKLEQQAAEALRDGHPAGWCAQPPGEQRTVMVLPTRTQPAPHDCPRRRSQELCQSLRSAYEQAWEQAHVEGECDLGAITIECQRHDGEMIQLTQDSTALDFTEVKALFVTTNIPHAAVLSLSGSSLAPPERATTPAADAEEAGAVLIDMSLAGCCGVQSSCGGLRITSLPEETSTDGGPGARKQRQVELARFRAAKFRHYFTM